MKKILATVLALTMIVCMSLTVFAANKTESPAEALVPNDTVTISVGASYEKKDATTDNSAVYSVDVKWSAISFKFTESANVKTWDPSTLTYKETETNSDGVWSGDDATITITNKSNRAISVATNWVKAENGADVNIVNNATNIADATSGTAQTGTVLVKKPTTGTIGAGVTTLGTITLTISAVVTES